MGAQVLGWEALGRPSQCSLQPLEKASPHFEREENWFVIAKKSFVLCQGAPLQSITAKEVPVEGFAFNSFPAWVTISRKISGMRPWGKEEKAAEPGLQPLSAFWQLS